MPIAPVGFGPSSHTCTGNPPQKESAAHPPRSHGRQGVPRPFPGGVRPDRSPRTNRWMGRSEAPAVARYRRGRPTFPVPVYRTSSLRKGAEGYRISLRLRSNEKVRKAPERKFFRRGKPESAVDRHSYRRTPRPRRSADSPRRFARARVERCDSDTWRTRSIRCRRNWARRPPRSNCGRAR